MNRTARISPMHAGLALLLLASLVGCVSTEPAERLAVARVAVTDAGGAGAGQYASAELKSASEKLAAAERAMAANDHLGAQRLAEEAEVEARLAAATARAQKAQLAADALQEDIRVLRQEIQRKTP